MLKGLTLRDWGIREAGTKVGMRVAEWSYSGKAEEETKKKRQDSPELGGAVTKRPSNDFPSRFEGWWW